MWVDLRSQWEANPRSQQDWPNPAVRPHKGLLDVSVAAALVLTLLAPSNSVTRGPVFTASPARKVVQVDAVPNLLTSTLAQAKNQTDWPNPVTKRWPIPDQVNNTTIAPLAQPFKARDQSNPVLTPARQSFEAPNLLGTTLAPTTAPFSQNDWPNPSWKAAAQAFDQPNLLGTTLSTPAPTVVVRGISSAPRFAPTQAQVDGPPNLLETTLAQAQAVPFATGDQANPVRVAIRPAFDPPNLLETTLAPAQAAMPFSQENWPNPSGRAPSPVADVPNLLTGILVKAPLPVSQTDWPNPRGTPTQQPVQPQNLLALAPPPAPATVIGRAPAFSNRVVAPQQQQFSPPNLTALIPPFVPGPIQNRQADWPNPIGRAPVVAQAFDPPNLLTSTLLIQPPVTWHLQPFPNLNRVAWEILPPNLLAGTLAPAQVPFSQDDWPNPRGARQPQHVGESASAMVLLTTPPPPLPKNQAHWPNPRGYEYPSSLRTFAAFAPIGFFPPAPPNKHRLYMDIVSGRLFWQISEIAPGSPTLILPL